MDAKDRINEFIAYKGISINQFEQSIGASNGYWRKVKNISAKVVGDIIRVYSELDTEWVITGEGNMLKINKQVSLIQSINGHHNITTGHNNGGTINTVRTDTDTEKTNNDICEDYRKQLERQNVYIKELLDEQKMLHIQISKLIDRLK